MKPGRTLNADDRALLEALLRDIGPRLYGYVRKAFNNVDAEDVIADVFARAADNIDALRAAKRKDLYLLTAARNACRDRFRRKQPASISHERLADTEHPAAQPAGCASRSEEIERLREAVTQLPDTQREVVVLRMTAGLKFEDIARLIGIPLGTALSRMNAAIGRLRRELGVTHVCRRR